MMSRKGHEGYSFIEMLTAIVVLGLMLTITILSMAPQVQKARVRSAVNMVSGDMSRALRLAVQHQRPMLILFQPATRQYQVRDRDSSSAVYVQRDFGDGTDLSLDSLAASPQSVEVYPNGLARETITVTVGIEGYTRSVRLTRAGLITIDPV